MSRPFFFTSDKTLTLITSDFQVMDDVWVVSEKCPIFENSVHVRRILNEVGNKSDSQKHQSSALMFRVGKGKFWQTLLSVVKYFA